jgi:hypothetical protein
MVAQVGYSVAERLRGRVVSCAVCTWHVETSSAGFLVEPQNQGRRFMSGLTSKLLERFSSVWPPVVTVSNGLASKPAVMVFAGLVSKLMVTVSTGLASKPVATVFTGLASKPVVTVFVGFASKPVVTVSSGLTSKRAATVFADLASKPVATVFSSLTLKLVATVSSGLVSKPVVGFLVEHENQGGGELPGLSLKTDSSGLVIWVSKSP